MGIAATRFSQARSPATFKAWFEESPAAAVDYLRALALRVHAPDALVRAQPTDSTAAVTMFGQLDALGDVQAARAGTLGWRPAEPSVRETAFHRVTVGEWSRLTPEQREARIGVARESGYLLVDDSPSGMEDTTGWSDGDVARMAATLEKLPPRFKQLPNLIYLVRDEQGGAEMNGRKLGSSGFFGKIAVAVQHTLGMHGGVAGEALFPTHETRLFSDLFIGSKVPGAHGLFDYTVVHELAHHLLFGDPELSQRWNQFYSTEGRAHAPNGYAQQNAQEGFGVAAGMYAVAPELLRNAAPATYAFLKAELGDSLDAFHSHGLEGAAIQFFHGKAEPLE